MVLNPVISKLSGKLVVLASASPRRLEILTNMGLRFEVVPSWFKETLDKTLFNAPHEYAVETAKQKALEVAKRMPFKHLKTPDIVIAADTIVTVDGLILEKPVDKHDAYRMLSKLSGKEHSVCTGVAILLCHEKENEEIDYQMIDFFEETKVKFADLSEDMLWEYINSGEPMDKAGGYGIQALGGMLVEYVHGDFLNVVGFPLNHFCKQLDLIYNHQPPSLDLEHAAASSSRSNSLANHIANRSSHCLPAGSGITNSLEKESSLCSSTCSDVPHDKERQSPSTSPVSKVKRKEGESALADSSWPLVNSLSKCSEGKGNVLQDEVNAVPRVTSGGHMNVHNMIENEQDGNDDLKRIIQLMDGFKASKALFTASKMRVFDLLHGRPGLDVGQVAEALKASSKGTKCLLEACVSLGLLESKRGVHRRTVYENTNLARRFLRSDSPSSLQGYMEHCDETVWPLFSHLEKAVREGTNQHHTVSGKTTNNVFQDTYFAKQEVKLRFMKAMHSTATVAGPAVARAFDLSRFRTACDLGGCTGAVAFELARAYPGLSVTVFDLPSVVEMSGAFRPLDTDNRVSFVAGDFLKDKLPKADLYILARILHDWSDEKVQTLLSSISDACTPGCGLLVSEIFLDKNRKGPSRGLLQALSLSEGKQRSADEYAALLEQHGFTTAHVTHTGTLLDVMLCIKD